ncbi:hypothetical protein GE061_006991 [Apolygus lucorum]|uniref:Cryptochrome/DNA photolyase FAD-binding domain-containing protein n=1 Tax=Apolygus lucorum TaxID=248454 RepID=A0A8S9WS88_APOLU|nr:hypothetical protein GE061_006991 [Apolygus lucorum]
MAGWGAPVSAGFHSRRNHCLSRNEAGEKLHGGPSVLEGAGRREGACARSGDAAGGAPGGGGGNSVTAGAAIGGESMDRERFMEEEEVERTVIRSGGILRRYVDEVRKLPVEYVYEPWTAPIEVQEQAGCVIGRDYPERIVDHNQVSSENCMRMETIRRNLATGVPHCCPSSTEELMQFMWLPPELHNHISKMSVDGFE